MAYDPLEVPRRRCMKLYPRRKCMKLYLKIRFVIIAVVLFSIQDVPAFADFPVKRLVVGTTMTIGSINIDDYYYGILRAILTHRALVQLDEEGAIVEDMAEFWKTDDARRWVFSLRPGLRWHDGKPVTAADVTFSMKYLLEKIPVYGWHFKLVSSIETLDDNRVAINLSEPNPRFLVNLLVLRIIPRHIFKDVSHPKKFIEPEATIGSGPYVFKGYDNEAGVIRFEPFERYYKGTPNVGEVVIRLFKNADTLNLAFRKGEVDLPYFYASGTDPVRARALQRDPNVKVFLLNNPGIPQMLFFNLKKPVVSNVDFRRALSYAVNYKEILNLFGGGYGSVPNLGVIPEGSLGYTETPPFSYNPQKARESLEKLGFVDQDGDGIREKNGEPLALELVIRTDTESTFRLGERLRTYLAAVGIDLVLKPVDNTLFRQISDKERSHTMLLSRTTPWGMMMWAGSGTGYLDARNIGWSVLDDPDFFNIVDQMNEALDTDTYLKAVADLQLYYSRTVPVIPLFWNKLIQPYNSNLKGWVKNPMYGVLWEDTWFELTRETP